LFTLKVDDEIELQLFQLHHANEVFDLIDFNRLHLRKWLPWVDSMDTPYQYHTIIPMWLKQFADNQGFNLGIRYQGTLVGAIGLHNIDWRNRQTTVGYYLGEGYQGRGIMTRAVQAILNHVFFELRLNRVEIRCGEGNAKSRAIPERLGFKMEGIIRDGENLYGYYHNLVVYGMLEREWIKINS
jgi:ribosomal-protein-serine acetyltransferase